MIFHLTVIIVLLLYQIDATVRREESFVIDFSKQEEIERQIKEMEEMEKERPDLDKYINLFGYNPKYGVEGKPIGSVTYKPQAYHNRNQQFIPPLYQQL